MIVSSDAAPMTTATFAPDFAAISISARPASIVFVSQTIRRSGNSLRSARTASIPSLLRSGVPTSSQSAPPSTASRASRSARGISSKSNAT